VPCTIRVGCKHLEGHSRLLDAIEVYMGIECRGQVLENVRRLREDRSSVLAVMGDREREVQARR